LPLSIGELKSFLYVRLPSEDIIDMIKTNNNHIYILFILFMKVVIQRVKYSSVTVEGKVVGKIDKGILILLGVSKEDTSADADFLINKIIQLRIFEDQEGKMNISAVDINADLLVVSQFTLYGDCTKGRRPSFDPAASPQQAKELYEYFVQRLKATGMKVETGVFGAMMDVALLNDGPVTFIIESKSR
jgi:D-tyrosyl-tRNA(Tyr) deacylase